MLRSPLKRDLRGSVDEEAIARMWRRIRGERGRWSRSSGHWIFAGVAAFALCAVALFGWVRRERSNGSSEAPPAPSALSLSDGTPLRPSSVAEGALQEAWSLSDGSRLVFDPGTRWEPLAISPSAFVSVVRKGATTFDVNPGGPRQWIVEAGPVRVEVVGTRFVVRRDTNAIAVSVERGAVLVRGAMVPDEVQRLTAGQHLEIPLRNPEPPSVSSAATLGASSSPAAPPVWLERFRNGKFDEAYRELGPEGIASEVLRARAIDRLLALTDVARKSGHPADAVRPLERIMALYPDRAAAAVAAVTLGRLSLDQLGRPQAAARALERALALGAPSGLREDIYVRLIEAYEKTGDQAAARQAMASYEREFPSGRKTPQGAH